MMLGATQAELFATFATGKFIEILGPSDIDWPADTVCKQLYEEKLDVDNYECFKNFRGSGSISFSPVTENTTVCLEQFEGDHCETGASKHEMTLVAEGKFNVLLLAERWLIVNSGWLSIHR